jgi:hypothetical protein
MLGRTCFCCGERKLLFGCSNPRCSQRGSNHVSSLMFWITKEKIDKTNLITSKPPNCYANYFELLFPELQSLIFSYCGINICPSLSRQPLPLEDWINMRRVSKSWFNILENVSFQTTRIHTVLVPRPKYERAKFENYVNKLPQEIIQFVSSLEVSVTKSKESQAVETVLQFSKTFLPLPEAKDINFIITDEYETGIVTWDPEKLIFPPRKLLYAQLPSLQTIQMIHSIITEKNHVLSFITHIRPKTKIVSTFIMKKEPRFVNFDQIHIRINFSSFGGYSIRKVENLILTGKTWRLEELQEFVILLPSLTSLTVDVSNCEKEKDDIINWVTQKFGPHFIIIKT